MKRLFRVRSIVTGASLLSAISVHSGQLAAQSRVYKSGVELVPLTVTVTDRAGHFVPDLSADDFAVYEEGRRQVVSHFAAGHVPIDVEFLLDTSSSMRHSLPLAQKAARGLLQQLRMGDRAAVTGIGSTVQIQQSITPELTLVDVALRATKANGNTALYEAVYTALRQFQQENRELGSEVRRQVLVLLSDGVDTASHVTFEDVLDLVRRVDVTVYVVALGDDHSLLNHLQAGRASFESAYALSTIARESGGRLFTPRAACELSAIYDAIGEELSSQYVIGYVPSGEAPDAMFRHVSVGVLEPKVGMARTRAGYYADRGRAGNGGLPSVGSIGR